MHGGERLGRGAIQASAPCRVDCGGSTDHRLTALLGRAWDPATTTIALAARTTVTITAHQPGKILVESAGLGTEEATPPVMPLDGPLGLIFAVVAHFGVHGVCVRVNGGAPPRSGLGGSGAATVATVGALRELTRPGGSTDARAAALLAHHLEDALYASTGLQDQAAAAFGGVHLWHWRYGERLEFDGEVPLVAAEGVAPHVVAAYSGTAHSGNRRSSVLDTIRQSGDLSPLQEIAALARAMGLAIRAGDYVAAGKALTAEFEVRGRLMREITPAGDEPLLGAARDLRCGVRFAGHGGGGSVWAIGEAPGIAALRKEWEALLARRENAFVFPAGLSADGLRVGRTG